MIADFHSHILPGIDDGSADLSESMAMLAMEAEQGIGHVVATPHFYARYDRPEDFLARRAAAEAALRREMEKKNGLPKLTVGAEVYYFRGMSDSDYLPELTIRGTSCILIEMPDSPWTDAMYRELGSLWEKRGLLPILAHLDRYIRPLQTHGILKHLEGMPLFVQANAGFFLERGTENMALRLLRRDQIQLLGSDCHDVNSRKPNLGDAVEKIRRKLGQPALERIARYQQDLLPE